MFFLMFFKILEHYTHLYPLVFLLLYVFQHTPVSISLILLYKIVGVVNAYPHHGLYIKGP